MKDWFDHPYKRHKTIFPSLAEAFKPPLRMGKCVYKQSQADAKTPSVLEFR
jgi:hypothetical protein